MKFEYPEDEKFFADLLTNGDITKLHTQYTHLFDFNHPAIKRWEFNKVSKKLLQELMEKYEGKCQLCIHPDCSKEAKFECDHIIPLSTNELNKTLRNMKRVSKEKVSAQSFGSNHIDNLILACKRCNAFKKHKILPHKFHP
jgi:5-methylcytosine-specific restriction endonuclease McrA